MTDVVYISEYHKYRLAVLTCSGCTVFDTSVAGDSSDVCLKVFIDKEIVRDLNFRVSLDDILVLRLNSGRDIFISFNADHQCQTP